jgi:hypothetical protein
LEVPIVRRLMEYAGHSLHPHSGSFEHGSILRL